MNFGERLREIREGRMIRFGPRISLRELARRTGISAATISQIETGHTWHGKQPPGDDIERLACGLGVSIEELTGRMAQSEADRGFDGRELREVVAYLESQPELLATLEQVRRENTPETYRRFVMSLARAWESNLRMALTLLAAREGESG